MTEKKERDLEMGDAVLEDGPGKYVPQNKKIDHTQNSEDDDDDATQQEDAVQERTLDSTPKTSPAPHETPRSAAQDENASSLHIPRPCIWALHDVPPDPHRRRVLRDTAMCMAEWMGTMDGGGEMLLVAYLGLLVEMGAGVLEGVGKEAEVEGGKEGRREVGLREGFIRSNAPSPEKPESQELCQETKEVIAGVAGLNEEARRKEEDLRVWLQSQIHTQMGVLPLQGRVDDFEKCGEARLATKRDVGADSNLEESRRLDSFVDYTGSLGCDPVRDGPDADWSAAGTVAGMRGGMGGRDEDEEYVYGDGEYKNWDQIYEEEEEERKGAKTCESSSTMDQGPRTETTCTDKAIQTDEEAHSEAIQELRRQFAHLEMRIHRLGETRHTEPKTVRFAARRRDEGSRVEERSRKEGLPEHQKRGHEHGNDTSTSMSSKHTDEEDSTHPLNIFVHRNLKIPSAGPGLPTMVFGQHTQVLRFRNGATAEQVLDLDSGRYDLMRRCTDDIRITRVVSRGVENELLGVLGRIFLESEGREPWDVVKAKWWSGREGETFIISGKDVQILYNDHAEEEVVRMRGGSGGEEEGKEDDDGEDCERDAKRMQRFQQEQTDNERVDTPIPTSPHLLCQRGTSRFGGLVISYIIIYVPPGFVIPFHGTGRPSIVFSSAATIYHFPSGATPDVVKREAWKQKACGEGHWSAVNVCRIQTEQTEQEIKNAVASMWQTMGLGWDVLLRGEWPGVGQGDTYLVNDSDLGLTCTATNPDLVPRIRGGQGGTPDPSILEPIQKRRSSTDQGPTGDFNRVYEHLMERTAKACAAESTLSECAEAWMTLASVLQMRNRALELELDEYKETQYSLIQDLHWQLGTQVELEEQVETAEADKAAMGEELEDLKLRWMRLVEFVTEYPDRLVVDEKKKKEMSRPDEDHVKSPGLWTMRGGHNEPKPAPSDDSISSESPGPWTASAATCFDFFPDRSAIVFVGEAPQIYQFPGASTLPEIQKMLESGSAKDDVKKDQYCYRILEIMKIRERMGVQLPDTLRDERVTIGIPYFPPDTLLDDNVTIAAWQTLDADGEGLSTLVQRLDIEKEMATKSGDASLKESSSDEEKDYYHDVGDLINTLIEDAEGDADGESPKFCVCDMCTLDTRETYFNISDLQPTPVVSVRGGGSSFDLHEHRRASDVDSDGNRQFPLLSPRLSTSPDAPPDTPEQYGTFPANASHAAQDHELAPSTDPLSLRLSRLMFPSPFVQQREGSICRFNWRLTKYLNPQYRDKRSRSFKYITSPSCSAWETQLDHHREHCDFCHLLFMQEDYASGDVITHEDDAPTPTSGPGRPWTTSTWPNNSSANTSPFPIVQDPDPRLRGGGGADPAQEDEALYFDDEEGEDWRDEWNDLASRTATSCADSSHYRRRTFRNSSTLSTKSVSFAPSPVLRSRRQHQISEVYLLKNGIDGDESAYDLQNAARLHVRWKGDARGSTHSELPAVQDHHLTIPPPSAN
ncbi:hypothetical protein BDW02DRAFT_595265 [Decorospora gaudefroyi]|uniref:Uncharacterized protein n=1 Tax=Decorospora gaudefroyi TaxID=184978 RepID=A0A6A5KKZ8_9PLEO|nr:hypothetical protein BDW02DRAFT_595265 [Decorospora gaudefroyi]